MPQVISRDGTPIGYEVAGSGPLVILVGGATQYRAVDARTPNLVKALAADYTVVTFDRRGRGESGDTWPYAVAREVEDIAALMDALGGEAYVYGMSSGAVLALEAAAAMPRRVKALALYEPPIDVSRSSADYQSDHADMAALAAAEKGEEMMRQFLLGVGMPAEGMAAFEKSPAWPAYASIGLTIEHDYRVLADARKGDNSPERWQNAIMPVLVINGDKSFDFMAAGADWVASGLHNGERITLADQSHDVDPMVLAPLLNVFFQMGSVVVH
jgi:pimeloyl-ACP methyl ester carboxylesterase